MKSSTAWATAAQLFPYTALDESALRRRARELNPATAAPWIPAPRGAKFEVHGTLAGVCAWKDHQQATSAARGLPVQCASMKDLEATYHLPSEMQKFIREKGLAPDAFDAGNRVRILPLLAAAAPFLRKIFCGQGARIAEITGFEELDLETQRAKSTAQDVIEKTRENALATGTLHTREGLERELAEPLTAVFSHLKNFEKTVGGKIKSLLTSAQVDPEIIRQTNALAAAGIQEPLTQLRAQLKLDQPEKTALKKAA